jgi:hypothetical protein
VADTATWRTMPCLSFASGRFATSCRLAVSDCGAGEHVRCAGPGIPSAPCPGKGATRT